MLTFEEYKSKYVNILTNSFNDIKSSSICIIKIRNKNETRKS